MKKTDYIELLNSISSTRIKTLNDKDDVVSQYGFSSIDLINLWVMIENKYNIVISFEDLDVDSFSSYAEFKKTMKKYGVK